MFLSAVYLAGQKIVDIVCNAYNTETGHNNFS